MRLNTKCSVALHCLVFLSEYEDQTKITSELLAKSTGCNSSAIRSILNDLQKAGIVSVVRGIGGAHLNKAPADLTFWDVYHALEPGGLEHFIGFHPNPSDQCPVGRQITLLLEQFYQKIGGSVREAMEHLKTASGRLPRSGSLSENVCQGLSPHVPGFRRPGTDRRTRLPLLFSGYVHPASPPDGERK